MSLATKIASYDPFEPTRLNPPRFSPQSMNNLATAAASSSVSMSAVASSAYSSRSYVSPSAPNRRQTIGSLDTPLSLPNNSTTDSPTIKPEDREKMSAPLCDLLRGLLTKCALYRPTWNAVETHPFWAKPESVPIAPSALPSVTIMPEQPAYEAFLK